jgi:lipopolysaccharide transport system permease protein
MEEARPAMTADSPLQFDYLRRIWSLRHFWFSLVTNDIRSRYRRSVLGVGWSLLRPLGMTAIFCTVFPHLFKQDIATYAPYVLISITIWQFFMESLLTGCHCFANGSAYIRQQKIPHAIFPLRTILGAGFQFLIAFGLGIGVAAYFQGIPSVAHLLFLPIAILILLALGWSLAIIAGVSQTYFPDTSHLLEIGMQILFYLTPIMYRASAFIDRGRLSIVFAWNPIQSILELFRQPLLQGEWPTAFSFGMSLAFTGAAAAIAWFLLRRLERTLVFWL